MSRVGEKEMNEEDVALLAQIQNMALSPEETELLEGVQAHLNQYGELTKSERNNLRKLTKAR